MMKRLLEFKPRRELNTYERLINLPEMMAIILVISFFAGLLAMTGRLLVGTEGNWIPPITFGAVSVISGVLFTLNRNGYYTTASLGLFLFISIAITYNMAIFNGIYDVGIFSFPLLIVMGSMIFGKKWVPLITIYFVGLLTVIHLASVIGPYQPFGVLESGSQDFYTNLILIMVVGWFILIVMNILDKNIIQIIDSEAKLQETYENTLNGWSKTLELRDRETEGHTRRVADLTVELCKHFDFSEEQVKFIRWGSLLHDIGKMGVPDEILRKPEKLNEDEFIKVRKHPEYAMQLLEGIPYLQQALVIPEFHHERYDGSGYPKGLKGEDIPLEARIFAVADVYDALVSERPYSPAWTEEEAENYIREQAGKEFDPEIAEVFLTKVLKGK